MNTNNPTVQLITLTIQGGGLFLPRSIPLQVCHG